MREIKFKGWHKPTKKMIDLYKITPLALDAGLKQDGIFLPFGDDVVLLQYTGFKDKNGKEIYDGDILGMTSYMDWVVSWRDGQFRAANVSNQYNSFILESDACKMRTIKGNIYETPKLLKF